MMIGLVAAATCVCLRDGWMFSRDGSASMPVSVPHDAAIAGPFDPHYANAAQGALPWKIRAMVYTRTLPVTAEDRGKSVWLRFGGVMAEPQVFVNGVRVGGWDYGYMGFDLDITKALKFDGKDRLEVRASTLRHESRWYPGAGIYRDVRLVKYDGEYVVPGTLAIRASDVTSECAKVTATYVSSTKGSVTCAFTVERPVLWSVENPHLYELELCGERFRYGIRTAEWTADDGFHLNGRRLQLKGVNLHSDLGPLGMAFNRSAARRQLEIMRDMGVNAIRTSHNPPDAQFLDLCDEMGFVVWDECYDAWNGTATIPSGDDPMPSLVRNVRAFVRRDRNHPCVILWSLGNEMCPDYPGYEYPPCGDGRHNLTRARLDALQAVVRSEDPTRPVGTGNAPWTKQAIPTGCWDGLDVTGWNYLGAYRDMKAHKPDQPLVISESASASSSYGYYETEFPANQWAFDKTVRQCCSYDLTACVDLADNDLRRVRDDRYLAGEFVWTGIDYLGEPSPFNTSARSSYFGCADLCGIPKDRYYLYRSAWNDSSETCHLLPHWNWSAGTKLPVFVYTSGDEAELFLNGRSLGRRRKGERQPGLTNEVYSAVDEFRLRWNEVAWKSGELKAVAYRGGRKVGEDVVRTAGWPVRVRLTPERDNPPDSTDDLLFVQVDVVDAQGVRDPRATNLVRFAAEGACEIVVVGNGDATGLRSFADVSAHPLFFGKSMVILRRTGPGNAALRAKADGLRDGYVALDPVRR